LAVCGIQISEILVAELVEQHVADELVDRPFGKEVVDQGHGRRWNRTRREWFEAHRTPPHKQPVCDAW
jgi:hypothetical protein